MVQEDIVSDETISSHTALKEVSVTTYKAESPSTAASIQCRLHIFSSQNLSKHEPQQSYILLF